MEISQYTVERTDCECTSDIHDPQRMHPNDFDEPDFSSSYTSQLTFVVLVNWTDFRKLCTIHDEL